MRQLLYVSRSTSTADATPLSAILDASRHNNALDGITGLLWSDGDRFAQVIEGDERAVDEAIARIRADPRHRDVTILHDRIIEERQFGGWSMQFRPAGPASDEHDERMRQVLDQASDSVRAIFATMIAPAT